MKSRLTCWFFREDANFHPPKSGSPSDALATSKHRRFGTLSHLRVSVCLENESEPLGPVFSWGVTSC